MNKITVDGEELEEIGKVKSTGLIIYKRTYCGCIFYITNKETYFKHPVYRDLKEGNIMRLGYCDGIQCNGEYRRIKVHDIENDVEWHIDIKKYINSLKLKKQQRREQRERDELWNKYLKKFKFIRI